MADTSVPEGWWQSFVDATPARTAKFAFVRTDGSPQVVPVWVAFDGGDIVFCTGSDSLKGTAVRRDPRVSLCWDDEAPPFSFVTIRGRASLEDDLPVVREWATRIGGRYMGAERAQEYGARNGVPGEVLVRVQVEHVIAMRDLAD